MSNTQGEGVKEILAMYKYEHIFTDSDNIRASVTNSMSAQPPPLAWTKTPGLWGLLIAVNAVYKPRECYPKISEF